MTTWRLLTGDVRDKLTELPPNSIQCVVTSPPYFGLRDYGTAEMVNGKIVDKQIGLDQSPDEYVETLVKIFRQIRRVLKVDGTVWLNLGDSYAAERTGPVIPSFKGTDPGTSVPGERAGNRNPEILRAAGLKTKDLIGIPWRVALALQADGWYLRSDIIWSKPVPMPESVKDRPIKSHEYVFLLTQSDRYYFHTRQLWRMMSVWTIPVQGYKGVHYATFPEDLARRCILAGSRMSGKRCECVALFGNANCRCEPAPADTVLDPFCGSGTAGVVAVCEERNFIGIDLKPDHIAQARERIGQAAPLFAQEQA